MLLSHRAQVVALTQRSERRQLASIVGQALVRQRKIGPACANFIAGGRTYCSAARGSGYLWHGNCTGESGTGAERTNEHRGQQPADASHIAITPARLGPIRTPTGPRVYCNNHRRQHIR
jgi:hypothetical protein